MGLFEPAEMAEFYLLSEAEERYEEPDAPLCDYNSTLPLLEDLKSGIGGFYGYSKMFTPYRNKYLDNLYEYVDVEKIFGAIINYHNTHSYIKNDYLDMCYSIQEYYDKNGYITEKQKMALCKFCVYNNISVDE